MRKFDLKEKMIAILLIAAMLVSYAPISGAKATDTNIGTELEAQNTNSDSEIEALETGSGPVCVTQNDQPVSAIDLPENEKTMLTASLNGAEAFQWQILVPGTDRWVNIYDKTTDACEVSVSLVGSLVDASGTAGLRCAVTAEGVQKYSDAVTVTITESTAPEPSEESSTEAEETDGYIVESEVITEPESEEVFQEETAEESQSGEISADETAEPEREADETQADGEPEVPEGETVVSYALSRTTGADEPMLFAGGEELTTRTVTIKYLYDTEGPDMTGSVANDYVATLATGTSYTATVSSPVRTGYKAYVAEVKDWNAEENHWFTKDTDGNYLETDLTSGEKFTLNVTNITENLTYYIVYLPQNTTFQVSSYLQNIYDDLYTYGGSDIHSAKVGSSVLLLNIIKREGFTTLQYDDAKVAADGSTILEIYYDREYHLMNFQLDGGYGVEPVYARYQTDFKVVEPTKAGYTFDGWEVTAVTYNGTDVSTKPMESNTYGGGAYKDQTYLQVAQALAQKLKDGKNVEIPPFDITFTAKWVATPVTYNVVYWRENANDDGYSYWGTVSANATAGATVTFNPAATEFNIANLSFSHKLVQEAVAANGIFSAIPDRYEDEYFTYNASLSEATATVSGDNSTVLNVYYKRNTYNLKFYYARTNGTVSQTETQVYPAEDEIVSGESYVVVMNRAVTNSAAGSVLSTTVNGNGLLLSGNMGESGITALKFTKAEGDNLYYVQSGDGKYLTVGSDTASFSDTQTALKVTYQNGYWAIGDSSGTYWMNHHGGGTSILAAGYTDGAGTGGTNLILYKPDAALTTVSVYTSTNNWDVATNTRDARTVESAGWASTGSNVAPYVNDGRYFIESETIDGYNYYYLVLKNVKYEQKISALWPSGVVPSSGGYSTPEWAPVDGCKFRTENGANATLKIYSTVSAEIINNPADPDSSKFVAWWTDKSLNYQYFHIYYSAIPGEETADIEFESAFYVTQPVISYSMAYNGWTQIKPIQLYGVTLVKSVISNDTPTTANEDTMNSYFYYQRNPHTLQFYNLEHNIKTDNLVYGQSVKNCNTLTAELMERDYYPGGYESGAYTFRGWSLSPDAYVPVDWENLKMDDADLSVYAFWEKVTHTVTFYETYNDLKSDHPIAGDKLYSGVSYLNPQQVPHGDPVQYHSTISRTGYNFIGWFYIDEMSGELVAFLPNNMPVNRDLKIYADWQAETMIKYTIHYKLIDATRAKDGTYPFADGYKYNLNYGVQTQIADDTTGQLQDGRTKTFSAKALPELWSADDPNNPTGTNYCYNHYPMLSSHAIMFSPDQAEDEALKILNVVRDSERNVVSYEIDYTFFYVKLDTVEYKIRYINSATNDNIFKDFNADPPGGMPMTVSEDIKNTNEAVTTERMKMISGYVPDEYQKRVVLTAFPQKDTDNVITFYYTENPEPMYFVEHLIENANGTWTQVAREFSVGKDEETITRTVNSYEGHVFNNDQPWVNTSGEYILPGTGENWIGEARTVTDGAGNKENVFIGGSRYSGDPITASGTLQKNKILVIRFYYTLQEYDYVVEHRILEKHAPDNWLFGNEASSTEKGKAKYGATIIGDASDDDPAKQWKTKAYEQGYWVEGDRSDSTRLKKSLVITAYPDKNVITFWYVDAPVEFRYRVVVENEVGINLKGCYVTPTQDSTKSHGSITDDVQGCTPVAGSGYRFEGWYRDEACTAPVASGWVGSNHKLTPQPEGVYNILFEATYYAKFVPIELTIVKEGAAVKATDTFLFRIQGTAGTATAGIDLTVSITDQGSTTIRYIPAGEYTITELTDWSWRYCTDGSDSIVHTVKADEENKVTFTNKPKDVHWLGGEERKLNQFKAYTAPGGS